MTFQKNYIPWNKGLTKENDERVAKSALSLGLTRKGKSSGMKGKHHSEESKEKTRQKMLGKVHWNKGKPLSEEHKRKCSISQTGKHHTEETKEKIRQKAIGRPQPEEARNKNHLTHRELWQNSEFAKMMFRCQNHRPNKLELNLDSILQEYFPNEWKYVGDGKVIIGGKCPDFINCNSRKHLIELFGEYWHKDSSSQDRIDYFKQYGFDTLVIWGNDLKNPDQVVSKIKVFSGVA